MLCLSCISCFQINNIRFLNCFRIRFKWFINFAFIQMNIVIFWLQKVRGLNFMLASYASRVKSWLTLKEINLTKSVSCVIESDFLCILILGYFAQIKHDTCGNFCVYFSGQMVFFAVTMVTIVIMNGRKVFHTQKKNHSPICPSSKLILLCFSAGSAVLQGGIFGLSGLFPEKYTQAVMGGMVKNIIYISLTSSLLWCRHVFMLNVFLCIGSWGNGCSSSVHSRHCSRVRPCTQCVLVFLHRWNISHRVARRLPHPPVLRKHTYLLFREQHPFRKT